MQFHKVLYRQRDSLKGSLWLTRLRIAPQVVFSERENKTLWILKQPKLSFPDIISDLTLDKLESVMRWGNAASNPPPLVIGRGWPLQSGITVGGDCAKSSFCCIYFHSVSFQQQKSAFVPSAPALCTFSWLLHLAQRLDMPCALASHAMQKCSA